MEAILGEIFQSASRKYMSILVVIPHLIDLMSAKPRCWSASRITWAACCADNMSSLTELRVRLCRKMKTKSSQNVPAHKYSLEQHILRTHYQTCIWMHVNVKIIRDVDLQEYGWTKMVDEELSETYVTPLWYKSKLFHMSLCIRLVRTSIFQV